MIECPPFSLAGAGDEPPTACPFWLWPRSPKATCNKSASSAGTPGSGSLLEKETYLEPWPSGSVVRASA